ISRYCCRLVYIISGWGILLVDDVYYYEMVYIISRWCILVYIDGRCCRFVYIISRWCRLVKVCAHYNIPIMSHFSLLPKHHRVAE
ncbi:hypothetical protein LOTGIDRAFT_147444, partial [Lottia gigantea]